MMNEDIEQLLGQLTPRGVRPELRPRVLAAVASQSQEETSWGDSCTVAPGGGSTTATPTPKRPLSLWERVRVRAVRERDDSPLAAEALTPCPSPEGRGENFWLRRAAWAVAASLLLGIAMNVSASLSSERHLARLYGPPPVSQQVMELAKMVEKATDAETARWVCRQMTVTRRSSPDALAKHYASVRQLIDELQTASKGSYHETPEKDTQMDRDRSWRTPGDRSGCQRHLRLDFRFTA